MPHDHTDVIQFPVGRSVSGGKAGWLRSVIFELRCRVGRLLSRIGAPGAVRPVLVEDTVTGRTISVSVGAFYTRVSVDGRDYYFNRFTGRFDGTGSGCGC